MPVLSSFSLPAFIQDFAAGSPDDTQLKWRWNINVSGWIQQAMPPAPSFFYDPISTDIPQGSASVLVQWNAFPGRLDQYYGNPPPNPPTNPNPLTQDQIYALADTGYYTDGGGKKQSFPPIPVVICPQADWSMGTKTFGPYGPRGWLDEYCEWSTARDGNGNLLRIDFACENPEYWTTLWKVSPQTVASLYQSVLNWDAPPARQVTVQVQDLQLMVNGKAVIDPTTGAPPTTRSTSGTAARSRCGRAGPSGFSGGAMHLTATPNTLQTELGLGAGATVQRVTGGTDPQAPHLLRAVRPELPQQRPAHRPERQYGGRRPVHRIATAGLPRQPRWPLYTDTDQSWILRLCKEHRSEQAAAKRPPATSGKWCAGAANVVDPVTGQVFPGAMILHAICQIPSSWLVLIPP